MAALVVYRDRDRPPGTRRHERGGAGLSGAAAGGSLSFGAFPLIEFTPNGRLMNEDMKGGETQLLQFAVNRRLDWDAVHGWLDR